MRKNDPRPFVTNLVCCPLGFRRCGRDAEQTRWATHHGSYSQAMLTDRLVKNNFRVFFLIVVEGFHSNASKKGRRRVWYVSNQAIAVKTVCSILGNSGKVILETHTPLPLSGGPTMRMQSTCIELPAGCIRCPPLLRPDPRPWLAIPSISSPQPLVNPGTPRLSYRATKMLLSGSSQD